MASLRACFLSILLAGAAQGAPAPTIPSPATNDQFCSDAQLEIVAAQVPIVRNEVFTELEGFVKSKPTVRPLETRQYVVHETGSAAHPRQISCKMKTADHLRSEYGTQAAGDDIGCHGVNARTLQRVLAALTPDERKRVRFGAGQRVRFAADIVTDNGPFWLEPYPMAREADGELVIQSKAMKNDWLDPRYLAAPPQFRGTRYCHFIAPEHLRRLLLGETMP